MSWSSRRALRAAIHALAPGDLPLYGPALIADDEEELAQQLGPALGRRLLREKQIPPSDALREVAEAIEGALAGERALTKDELHTELRSRVRGELLPWCRGCGNHHVAPMLWRFAGVKVGIRCDSQRRFRLGEMGSSRVAADGARRFLRFYGPATSKEFGAWAGLAWTHARRLWTEIEEELVEVRVDNRRTGLLLEDEPALDSPPTAAGVRLLPPHDPYLQQYDRTTLAPDPDLRKRLFRPAASPGVVLQNGRVAGLWRARRRGSRTELEIEELERVDRDELEGEASLVAEASGSRAAAVRWT